MDTRAKLRRVRILFRRIIVRSNIMHLFKIKKMPILISDFELYM